MSDFLDNLIDRHSDAMPQITPRLPSFFEPEVSRSGLDLAVKEEATGPEETDILRQPPRAAQPVSLPTVAEPVRPIVSPAPTAPVEEENPSVKVDLNSPTFSLAPRETSILLPSSQGAGPLQGGDLEERFPQPSATLITPIRGRVRHARQEERIQHRSPTLKATAREQPSVKVDLNSPTFSLAPRETSILLPSSQGAGPLQGGDEERARGPNQGFLNPSTSLIAPIIPSMAEPERPMSRPDPVINVTIGRIEVRATASPQKRTTKPDRQTPVMGLEEYLRRRSGGQDR